MLPKNCSRQYVSQMPKSRDESAMRPTLFLNHIKHNSQVITAQQGDSRLGRDARTAELWSPRDSADKHTRGETWAKKAECFKAPTKKQYFTLLRKILYSSCVFFLTILVLTRSSFSQYPINFTNRFQILMPIRSIWRVRSTLHLSSVLDKSSGRWLRLFPAE